MKISKTGLILSLSYLGLFLIAGIYASYHLVVNTGTSELCGLPAILITLPWSILLMPIINALGVVTWYEQFSSKPLLYGFWAMMTLLPAALINVAILYTAGSYCEKASGHRQYSKSS